VRNANPKIIMSVELTSIWRPCCRMKETALTRDSVFCAGRLAAASARRDCHRI
jgi:hypothetical protein